ncbi:MULTISPECIES: preprotein translocase subunit YajC [Porphyromonas]|jgi:preprotein translocase, yajC subunit|uniref:preprotein translocase subunit YajC n=1 Tax=Porphyromonas TaxID=836 RepID=UPI001C003E3A|nr:MULTISPECIES: preprotein translocase subunit YajC [Porphyromonas]MBF1266640.1 preprotein translocase subunit YajC [Porphyromonadaceae bacterium]MBF1366158.1 preprotein translocase subunit YajC [Porphyromonadaceae bacterium]MBF1390488.1 preprotein translocase subunit YajC [Porphyromonas sp.]
MEMILLQAAGQNAGGGYSTIIMMVAIFVIFWLFMIRPQQKRQKELQQKRDALGINDRIVTSGGLYGVIKDVKQTELVVEIADGVRVRVDKGSVFPAGDPEAAAK